MPAFQYREKDIFSADQNSWMWQQLTVYICIRRKVDILSFHATLVYIVKLSRRISVKVNILFYIKCLTLFFFFDIFLLSLHLFQCMHHKYKTQSKLIILNPFSFSVLLSTCAIVLWLYTFKRWKYSCDCHM